MNIPSWLKTDPFVAHLPQRTIFAPQRRIIRRDTQAYLADFNGMEYPFSDCHQVRWEWASRGLWLVIPESGTTLTLIAQQTPKWGTVLVVSNGDRRVGVRLDDIDSAARSLLNAFPGSALVEALVEQEVTF